MLEQVFITSPPLSLPADGLGVLCQCVLHSAAQCAPRRAECPDHDYQTSPASECGVWGLGGPVLVFVCVQVKLLDRLRAVISDHFWLMDSCDLCRQY